MILTFYSYKGGVGRTSLALDTAARLAIGGDDHEPLRVLVWDLDLDAPGVAHFPPLDALATRATTGTHELLGLLSADARGDVGEAEVLDVLRRAIVSDPQVADGRLSLLLPGGRPGGADSVAPFAPGGGGSELLALAADLARRELGFDVVVVDARTGINDLADAATTVLADCAALVFRLDGQDLAHVATIADSIANAWTGAGGETPNRLRLVANLVPGGDATVERAVAERRAELEAFRLGTHVEFPLRPLALVREAVPSLDVGMALEAPAEAAAAELAAWAWERWADYARRSGDPRRVDAARRAMRGGAAVREGRRFEHEVAELLALGGWRTTIDYQTGGAQFDIRAEKDGDFGRRRRVLVECKSSRDGAKLADVEKLGGRVETARLIDGARYEAMLVGHGFAGNAVAAAEVRDILLATPAQLLDELAPAGPVRHAARARWEGTALERQYVAPTAVELDADGAQTERRFELDALALGWLARDRPGLLCVLGDFGAGKTTFCLRLAARLAQREGDDAPLALLVELRRAGSTALTLDGLLRHALDEAGIDAPRLGAWRRRLEHGSLVLVVDGFDELLGYTDPGRMTELLAELQRAAATGRVVLSSRSGYFRTSREAATAIHGRPAVAASPAGTALWRQLHDGGEVSVVEVLPFDESQIRRYVAHRFDPDRAGAIADRLLEIHPVDELLHRPYLLALVAGSVEHWESVGWPTTLTLSAVYEAYFASWLDRERVRMGSELLSKHAAGLIAHLARVLWDRPSAQMTSRELGIEASRWCERILGRAIGPDEAADIEVKVRTALFLVRTEGGEYGFAHRSFLEFFLARALDEAIRADPDVDAARAALDLARLTPEVADFMCGLDGWAAVPDLARRVLREPAQSPRASANALLLAVWHLRGRADGDAGELDARVAATPLPAIMGAGEVALLECADLSRAELSGVDLSGAHLAGADLRAATLRGADLAAADLDGAYAADADLSAARLTDAGARGIDLSGASLEGADLRRADLRGAVLRRARLARARLAGADLTRADLNGADLRDADLTHCVLAGSDLGGADLRVAAGEGADLRGARLVAVRADGAPLSEALMEGVDLRFARLRGAALPPDAPAHAAGVRRGPTVAALTLTTAGHAVLGGGSVTAFDVEGRTLVAIGTAAGVVLWDPVAGELVRRVDRPGGMVQSVCSVAGGDGSVLLAGGGEGGVLLWDPVGGELVCRLEGPRGVVWSVCSVAGGDGSVLLAGGGEGGVLLWDPVGGELVCRLEGPRGVVWSVCSVAGGDGSVLLAGGGEGGVLLWDPVGGELVRRLKGPRHVVQSVCSVAGGDGSVLLAASGGIGVLLWDPVGGELVRRLEGPRGMVHSVCSVAGGDGSVLLAGGGEGGVSLWDPVGGELVRRLAGSVGVVCAVAGGDGSVLLAGGGEGGVLLWDPVGGELVRRLERPGGMVRSVCSVAGGDGSVLLAASGGIGVLLWDPVGGELVRRLEGPRGMVRSVCSVAGGDGSVLLAAGGRIGASLWDPVGGELVRRLERPAGVVWSVCWVAGGDGSVLLAGGGEGGVSLWDPVGGELVRRLERPAGVVLSVCSVAGGDGSVLLAAGTDDGVSLWDPVGGELVRVLEGPGGVVWSVCSVAGRDGSVLLAVGGRGGVSLWDPVGGVLVRRLEGPGGGVRSVGAVARGDGSVLLAGGGDGGVSLWDPVGGELLRRLEGPGGMVWSVCAVAGEDGSMLLAAGCADGSTWLWDLRGGEPLVLVAGGGSDWMSYRHGALIAGERPAARGSAGGLDRLLLAGGRWDADDVRLVYPDALEVVDARTAGSG